MQSRIASRKRLVLVRCLVPFMILSLVPVSQSDTQWSNRTGWKAFNIGDEALLYSPTPREFTELRKFACFANESRPRVSHEQLVARYASTSARMRQVVENWNENSECRRDPTAWRYNYIDESDGKILLREESVDERAANVLYMVRAVKNFAPDSFAYNWGDPRKDLENMLRVAGPNVDDDLCVSQLKQMLSLIEDLNYRVGLIRLRQESQGGGGIAVTNGRNGTHESLMLTDKHLSLAKILDSYGRYGSGLLFGKMFFPGSPDQCQWNKLVLGPRERVNMRFCWAHLNFAKHLDPALRERPRTSFEGELNVLYSGICIPESCHSRSFFRLQREFQELLNLQFRLPNSVFVDEHMEVSSVYCLVDEGSEFGVPLEGKLLLGFLVGWCALTVFATLWNRRQRVQRQASPTHSKSRRSPGVEDNSLLAQLDLGKSWDEFLTDYSDSTRIRAVQLDAVNIIKILGCAFVVMGHTMALNMWRSVDEVRLLKYIETDATVCLILAGTVVVDTFFVISGILWAYFTLKRLNKRRDSNSLDVNNSHLAGGSSGVKPGQSIGLQQFAAAPDELDPLDSHQHPGLQVEQVASCYSAIGDFFRNWFTFTTFRYLRVVPLFVLVHWFKKYVFIYAGSGPFWDHGLNEVTANGHCHKEPGWSPFTFLASFRPLSRQCLFPAWSVGNDIYFAIMAPPLILLMNKRPRLAGYITGLSCFCMLLWSQYALKLLPDAVDEELKELRSYGFYRFFDYVSHFYTAPHYRIFCFLAGVWAGYFLYNYQLEVDKRRVHRRKRIATQTTNSGGGGASVAQDSMDARKSGVQTGHEDEAARRHQRAENAQDERDELEAPARIEWPQWMRGIGTQASLGFLAFVAGPFILGSPGTKHYVPTILYRISYFQFLTSIRILWALANAILLLRMMTDWKDNLVMRVSASKIWQIFTKLNYAILLIHLDLLLYTLDVSSSMPLSFTKWGFFSLGAGIYMICIPLSLFVHVVFENPMNRLIMHWLPEK